MSAPWEVWVSEEYGIIGIGRYGEGTRYLRAGLMDEAVALLRESLNFPTHDIVEEDALCRRIRAFAAKVEGR